MRVAIYHNLPDGGAIRALFELVKYSYDQVEYDLYQLAPLDESSRYDLRPYIKNCRSYNFSYKPSRLDLLTEVITQFSKLRNLQEEIAKDIDSNNYDAVFVHHCAIAQTPFLLEHLKTRSLYFIQEPRRLSFEREFYDRSKLMVPITIRIPWAVRQKILKGLDIKNAQRSSEALCNSYFAQKGIRKAYGINAKVCYLGIDSDCFTYKKSVRKNQIVVVGTLHPAKGQDLAIRSLAQTAHRNMQLIFIYENYDERYKAELIKLSDRLKVNIIFKQGITDAELVHTYQESKLTLAVATKEPFGFTPIESAACGTPTVAVSEGGYVETIVENENGFICERNEASIANTIEKSIFKKWDPVKMSREARKMWSWRASANTYLDALSELTHE